MSLQVYKSLYVSVDFQYIHHFDKLPGHWNMVSLTWRLGIKEGPRLQETAPKFRSSLIHDARIAVIMFSPTWCVKTWEIQRIIFAYQDDDWPQSCAPQTDPSLFFLAATSDDLVPTVYIFGDHQSASHFPKFGNFSDPKNELHHETNVRDTRGMAEIFRSAALSVPSLNHRIWRAGSALVTLFNSSLEPWPKALYHHHEEKTAGAAPTRVDLGIDSARIRNHTF